MKALLIGVLFAILVTIGGTLTFMVMDSSRTIEANVVTNGASHVDRSPEPAKTPAQEPAKINTDLPAGTDSTTGISAKDQLAAFKSQEKITSAVTNSAKVGYTLNYTLKQSGCAGLIELKQDAVDGAQSDYDDAKKAYDKATDELFDLEDADAIADAQDDVKEKKSELDKAEKVLFSAKEDLIKARTTCAG
jgi:hypothetical protein